MTIHWKAVEQHFTMVLFVFQFYPDCNFGKFVNLGFGTLRNELTLNINFSKNNDNLLSGNSKTSKATDTAKAF